MDMNKTTSPAADFTAGYDYVTRDVAGGMDAECSFDLAATPGMGRTQAFRDGARAAVNALTGNTAAAERYAAAYGIPAVARAE